MSCEPAGQDEFGKTEKDWLQRCCSGGGNLTTTVWNPIQEVSLTGIPACMEKQKRHSPECRFAKKTD